MTTMDVSHIRNVLQSLTKNHINVPIISNNFEETSAMNVYSQIMTNEYDDFDDFDKECMCVSSIVPTPANIPVERPSAIRSLLQCLSIVKKQNNQTPQESSKVEMMQLLLDIKEFLSKTLLKDLDITKMKFTKKKLKEDIDIIYKNVDSNNDIQGFQDNVKGLLVIASRYLQKEIHVEGDLQLHVPCKSSVSDNIYISCINNYFTLIKKV
jgi:hypothetical protein